MAFFSRSKHEASGQIKDGAVSEGADHPKPDQPISVWQGVTEVNERIKALIASNKVGEITVGLDLARGIRIEQDGENPRDIAATSPAGSLIRLRASENENSRWMALHIMLGPLDLQYLDILGLVVHSSETGRASASAVCLRSGNGNDFRDFFLEKHLVSTLQSSMHVDLARLADHPEIPLNAEWRDLILFFPKKEVDLTITKLSIFAA